MKIKFITSILLLIIIAVIVYFSFPKTPKDKEDIGKIDTNINIEQEEIISTSTTTYATDEIISLKEGTVKKEKKVFMSSGFDTGESSPEVTTDYTAKIISNGPEYYIQLNDGPSGDPHFEYFIKSGNDYINVGSTPRKVIIPGNGFIYSSGSTFESFPTYTKYKIDTNTGRIVEVRQPYVYIGLKTKANKNIDIVDNDGSNVATIAKGSPIEVLLLNTVYYQDNKDRGYTKTGILVKTQYNIVGWNYDEILSCLGNDSKNFPIDNFCYGGD
jgi:hypothetical protein